MYTKAFIAFVVIMFCFWLGGKYAFWLMKREIRKNKTNRSSMWSSRL